MADKKEKDKYDNRYRRYLYGNIGTKGKDTTGKSKRCDKCGASISMRNTNRGKWGKHIVLCNACKKREGWS